VNPTISLIRRLLTGVLLPALLYGAGAPAASVHATTESPVVVLVAVDAISASPALPGSAAASALAALDVPASTIRPADRNGPDGACGSVHARVDCTRAAQLARRYLHYVRTLELARLSLPATCGNPPPASVA
jgi:hypothetical protein